MKNYILEELECIKEDMNIWKYITKHSYACNDIYQVDIGWRIEKVVEKLKNDSHESNTLYSIITLLENITNAIKDVTKSFKKDEVSSNYETLNKCINKNLAIIDSVKNMLSDETLDELHSHANINSYMCKECHDLNTDIMILIHNSYKNIEDGYHHNDLIHAISDNLRRRLNVINDHMVQNNIISFIMSIDVHLNKLEHLQDTKGTDGAYKDNDTMVEKCWFWLNSNIKSIKHMYRKIPEEVQLTCKLNHDLKTVILDMKKLPEGYTLNIMNEK